MNRDNKFNRRKQHEDSGSQVPLKFGLVVREINKPSVFGVMK